MPVKNSRFYNDPNLGAAFDNIASIFAPPDSGDAANYALAKERNQRNDIVSKLAADPRYAGFDQQGILADLFDPNNSFAMTERGQDVTARTSITNNQADNVRVLATNAADNTRALGTNALDNRTSLLGKMFDPLAPGEVRPTLPGSISEMYGLPELPQTAGTAKPMSETEWDAAQKQRLLAAGTLKDSDILAAINGDIPVENVVGPDGKPVVARRPDAVGQQPYFNKGAEAKPTNGLAVLADGTQAPAIQREDGKWVHAQTGQEFPPDVKIYDTPKPTGTNDQLGIGKPTNTYIERSLIDIAVAKQTATTLRDLIATAPASQGVVGFLRGTTQNVLQTGGELGTYFGGQIAEVTKAIEDGAADANLAGAFDPNIPAIDMLSNLLAFQYAKTTTGERLSNEMLKASRSALGLDGLDANQANSLARLDQAIAQINAQEAILKRARGEGVDNLSKPAPSATETGEVVPEGVDPADWQFMSPEDKALFQ